MANGQEALQSPFGNRPNTLDSPIPGRQEQEDVLAQFRTGAPTGQAVPLPEAAQPQALDTGAPAEVDLLEQFRVPGEQADVGLIDVAEERTLTESLTPEGIREGIQDSITRFKLSFAVNDFEREASLKKIFGPDNVRKVNDDFFFRKQGQKKFRKLDPDDFELIDDTLDFSREIVEGLVGAGGIAAGTVVAPGPGTAAGAVVGGAAGVLAADKIGELLGIERDPKRSALLEAGIAGAFNFIIPAAGAKLVNVGKNLIKARKAAIPEEELLSVASREIETISKELSEAGLIQNIPGTDTPIALFQLHPNSEKALAVGKVLNTDPTFRKAIKDQGDLLTGQVKDILKTIGNVSGRKPLTEEALAKSVVNAVDTLRKAEGAAIGKFRLKAAKNIGRTAKAPLTPNVRQSMGELMEELGFRLDPKGMMISPSIDDVLQQTQLPTAGAARAFTKNLENLFEGSKKGLTLDEFGQEITVLSRNLKTANRAGGNVKRLTNQLSSGLRAERNDIIESGLEGADKLEFRRAMQKFGTIMDSQQTLARTLDDSLASHSLVKDIFSKGKQGLPKLRAARAVLKEENPEVWNRLTGEWIDQLVIKHTKDADSGLNITALRKEFMGFGDEFLGEVFKDTGQSPAQFMKLLQFGQRLEKTNFSTLPENQQNILITDMVQLISGSKTTSNLALLSMWTRLKGNKSAMLQTLSQDGIDKFLGRVPKADQPRVRKQLLSMMDVARASGLITFSRAEAMDIDLSDKDLDFER